MRFLALLGRLLGATKVQDVIIDDTQGRLYLSGLTTECRRMDHLPFQDVVIDLSLRINLQHS